MKTMRNACVRRMLGVRTDHIARATNGMQKRSRKALVDLGAQTRDMDVDHVGLRVEMVFPDILQEHGAGDDLSGMAHQIFEKTELARLQLDGGTVALGGTGEKIELEIADGDLGLHRARIAAADERIEPREEFGESVRLGE